MWCGSLSDVLADLKVAEWVSVDDKMDEKAGTKVQLNGDGEGERESGWPFCCLLHSGRDLATDKLAKAWGTLVRGRLQGWWA